MENEKKSPCHGIVVEIRKDGKSTYELECHGDCDKGKCDKRSEKDHHGTVIEWCGCEDGERTCNIYISTDARGRQFIDCFTLGCKEGMECRLVALKREERDGVMRIEWTCACVMLPG